MDKETREKIQKVLDDLDTSKTKYPGMSYEQGIEEFGLWLLGEISDEEFEFGKS